MLTARFLVAVIALGAVLPASPALAESAAARAIASLLLADDMSEVCAEVVRRRGPQESEAFIIEGVRVLIKDGHRKTALNNVNSEVSRDEMHALQDRILLDRGLTLGSRASICGFAAEAAGTKDAVGRFLERVQ
jgi:hypothetical protein